MGNLFLLSVLLFSRSSFGEFPVVENLKFKVSGMVVSQLNCLQDRERPIGAQNWSKRFTSQFSIIMITKPSYLNPNDLALKAFATIQKGGFINSGVYDSILRMSSLGDTLILTDKVDPSSWSFTFAVSASGADPILNISGIHIDKSRGIEYELNCSL